MEQKKRAQIFTLNLGDLHRPLLIESNRKSLASHKRVSMAEIIREALTEYFEKRKSEKD